ncbi:MAG: tyrosine-type recombinase/integrase [Ghiorsea sp.]|nr:tyrosine-type recombinase/integrase [Ghiorsea sp.]
MAYITNDMQLKTLKVPNGQRQLRNPVGNGLYLLVRANSKSWRWDFRLAGKRDTVSLGTYPETSLKVAKQRLAEAKALQQRGTNPREHQQKIKAESIAKNQAAKVQKIEEANTFNSVSLLWLAKNEKEWSESHYNKQASRLNRHIIPAIGSTPLKKVTRKQVTSFLLELTNTGKLETAKRCGQIVTSIFDYAFNAGLVDSIPIGNLSKVLPAPVAKKMAALSGPKEIGGLLRALPDYQGEYSTRLALQLLPYLAVRGGEYRHAEWQEINLDDALWTIPAKHRKLKKRLQQDPSNTHLVPLSWQAIALLRELYEYTGHGTFLFPSSRTFSRPMSENTINGALARLGFKGQMVGHGWRTVFSTTLNTLGFNPDAIELQLSHTEKNQVRAAYNRSDYMEERVKMMQVWADYLDSLLSN